MLTGGVLISEVMYDPPQPTDYAWEWVELFNASGRILELVGWSIEDNYEADPIPPLALEPGAYAVVAASSQFFDSYPGFSGKVVFIADGRIGNGLSNTGDRIILKDSAGQVMDAVSYGEDTSVVNPAPPLVAPGRSLERQAVAQQSGQPARLVDNESPSPGRGPLASAPSEPGPPLGDTVPPGAVSAVLLLGLACIIAGVGIAFVRPDK